MMALTRPLTFPATRRLASRLWTSRRREIVACVAFPAAAMLAAAIRDLANRTPIPHQREYVIRVDRAIGFGTTPTERLQGWLYTGHASALDWASLALHISWFFVPALLTVYIIFRRWELVRSYAIARTGILFVALIPFFVVPTEPPWMALHVHRVLSIASDAPVNADWNTVAAFPSLHVAVPAVQALWLRRHGMTRLALVFAVYTVLTAAMAVYTGEHYVADVVAGVVLAFLMASLASWYDDRAERRRRLFRSE